MKINGLKRILVFLMICGLLACGSGPGEETSTAAPDSSKILGKVMDQYWQFLLADSIYLRQKYGLKIEHLPDLSYGKKQADVKKQQAMLENLKQVHTGEISYDEQLSLALLKWSLKMGIEGHRFFWLQIPITSYFSPIPGVNRLFTEYQFQEPGDPAHYLELMKQYPVFIRQVTAILKKQHKKKIILPKPALVSVTAYLESLAQSPDKSFFHIQADRLNADGLFGEKEGAALFRESVSTLVEQDVNPAIKEMIVFLKGDYLGEAPESVGLWQYPGGKEYYRFLLGFWSGIVLDPEQVHRIGHEQIEQLTAELDKVQMEVEFKGDTAEFLQYLRTDERFRPRSPEHIGERLTTFNELARVQLPRFFSKMPKAPCGVKRLNPRLEATMTYGYYQTPMAHEPTGYYFYNASNLEKKNVLNVASAALIVHELLPGHHFQVMLQAENEALPNFRKELFISGYGEGWAEYAAHLGREMGVYKDPYERCGRIMQDMFMSVRLVVDTGMNYLKWPRKKAMDFMKKHLLVSDVEIETETLRYSTGIPGQALGYKLGNIKFQEFRNKAEKALGDAFDIRRFHDALLASGTLPFTLLEKHIDRFIENEKATL